MIRARRGRATPFSVVDGARRQLAAMGLAPLVGAIAACGRPPMPASEAATLYEHRPATWFEELAYAARVSPDGRWALYGSAPQIRLINLASGALDARRLRGPFEEVHNAVFGPDGQLVRLITADGVQRWVDERDRAPLLIPPDALPVWSPDGRRVAAVRSKASTAGVTVDGRTLAVPGRLLSVAWTPDGETLVTVARESDDTVTLGRVPMATGTFRPVVEGLDAAQFPAQIAVSPDGREVILALSSPSTPDPRVRHDPNADRDLDLWAVDSTTGAKRLVIGQPGDDFAPQIVDGQLIWTHAVVRPSVVMLPVRGRAPRTVVDRGELPYWSHDGRQLGFMVGGWRLQDMALPLDAHVVELDEQARPTSAPRPLIVGFHEDFTPAWSPDGKWLAFHSHRSPTPVTSYVSPGSTDDVWIAPAQDPAREQRLTDFGYEAGMADWAPDSARLAFVSYEKANPTTLKPWIVTMDGATGARRDARRLPLPPGITSAETLAFSPDGERLAIESKAGHGRHAIWVLSLADSTARQVTEHASATLGGVDWTPDGRTLIYGALVGERMQLVAVDIAGGDPRPLTHGESNVFLPQVSPDGRWVAATSMQHMRRVLRTPLE